MTTELARNNDPVTSHMAADRAFKEIKTVEQLDAMDSDLMVKGYLAGRKDAPDYTQRDQSYWHGYLNGQVDGGHMQISETQCALARAVVARWRAN